MTNTAAVQKASCSQTKLLGNATKTLIYEMMAVECSCLEEGVKKLMEIRELWENCEPTD